MRGALKASIRGPNVKDGPPESKGGISAEGLVAGGRPAKRSGNKAKLLGIVRIWGRTSKPNRLGENERSKKTKITQPFRTKSGIVRAKTN